MSHRIPRFVAAIGLLACIAAGAAIAEVYVVIEPGGGVTAVISPAEGRAGRAVWEPKGVAASGALVLNPNGDLKGDGTPAIATDPRTGYPVAVWAAAGGRDRDIVISSFDGSRWTPPVAIHPANTVEDADPRIAFTSQGSAVVAWWEKGTRVVRLAIRHPGGAWQVSQASASGEKASRPELRVDGSLTILAYQTPSSTQILLLRFSAPDFDDGPTPFPREGGSGKKPPAPGTPPGDAPPTFPGS